MLESPKIRAFLPLLGLILGGTAQATEPLRTIDIPSDVSATEAEVLGHTDMNSDSDVVIPDTAQLGRTVEQYVDTIEELEKSHGIFHDRIGEELIGLGLAYKNLGQYRQAIDAFNRSLHINRINQGLHNPSQIPILELLIETNAAVSDWEALDQNYHYFRWINRRRHGENDPYLLSLLDRLGRWHLNEYRLGSYPDRFKHLLFADNLFLDAVEFMEASFGPNDPRLLNALYGVALTTHYMASASYVKVGDMYYRRGEEAMLQLIDIYANNPQLPADGHILALTYLGDWYLLFNKYTRAKKTYKIAYAKLTGSSMQQDDIDRFLSQPRRLPAFKLPNEDQQDDRYSRYVIAKFDLTKTGRAKNIEIIESSPANDFSLHRQAKMKILSTRFRPRIEDGQPVKTPDVNMQFKFKKKKTGG